MNYNLTSCDKFHGADNRAQQITLPAEVFELALSGKVGPLAKALREEKILMPGQQIWTGSYSGARKTENGGIVVFPKNAPNMTTGYHSITFSPILPLANFGDANPIDYGGAFLWQDGESLELEILEPSCDDMEEGEEVWTVSRLCLESKPEGEWFWKDLSSIEKTMGFGDPSYDGKPLADLLRSADPIERGQGYMAIIGHWGVYQFDQDPYTLNRQEVEKRFGDY